MFRKSIVVPVAAATLSLFSVNAVAQAQGDWLVRIGVANVAPDTDSDNLIFEGVELDDYRIDVDDGISAAFNVTYMATDNIGVELLASLPFEHDIDGAGVLEGLGELGSTKHLPPTLSFQYHFRPEQTFRPYVGLGFNYTYFSDEETTPALHQGIISTSNAALGTDYSGGSSDLNISNSFGVAAQLGADVALTEDWFVNFDLRWIRIEADATITTRTTDGDGFDQVLTSEINSDIDPWVFTTAFGMRF